jgi:hypothetical protein
LLEAEVGGEFLACDLSRRSARRRGADTGPAGRSSGIVVVPTAKTVFTGRGGGVDLDAERADAELETGEVRRDARGEAAGDALRREEQRAVPLVIERKFVVPSPRPMLTFVAAMRSEPAVAPLVTLSKLKSPCSVWPRMPRSTFNASNFVTIAAVSNFTSTPGSLLFGMVSVSLTIWPLGVDLHGRFAAQREAAQAEHLHGAGGEERVAAVRVTDEADARVAEQQAGRVRIQIGAAAEPRRALAEEDQQVCAREDALPPTLVKLTLPSMVTKLPMLSDRSSAKNPKSGCSSAANLIVSVRPLTTIVSSTAGRRSYSRGSPRGRRRSGRPR